MRKKIIFFLAAVIIPGTLANAQQSPEDYKRKAYNKIEVSSQLAQRAQSLLRGEVTRDKLRTAIEIMADAGEGYEEAANILRALGPDHVDENELRFLDQAVENSVEFIKRSTEHLQRMR